MFWLFAIPLLDQTTLTAPTATSFLARPIDAILFDLFIWTGWIPIAITLAWGFVQMWVNYRAGQYVSGYKFVLLAIDVPAMTEQTPKALENLFSNIYGAKSTLTWKEKWIIGKLQPVFSFEIISSEGYIQFLVRTQTRFRDSIEAGIYAHYPDAEINEVEDYVNQFPDDFPNEEYDMWGSEFTLDKDQIYPIRTYVDFEDRMTGEIKDPLGYTLEQMAKMKPGEHFWIQMCIQPTDHDWIKAGVKKINELYGKKEKEQESPILVAIGNVFRWPLELLAHMTTIDLGGLFGLSTEELKKEPIPFLPLQETKIAEAIYNKISKVGMGTKIRILYVGRKNVFVKVNRTAIVKGILNQYANLSLNKFSLFIPQIPKDDYFWMRWVYTRKQRTLMKAYKTRNWGIGANPLFLNTEELASLWHFPTIGFKAPLIKKADARRAEPPVGLPVTHEEQTLPVLAAIEESPSGVRADLSAFEVDSSAIKKDAIGSAEVPKVKPPTKFQDESFVPPNLPM